MNINLWNNKSNAKITEQFKPISHSHFKTSSTMLWHNLSLSAKAVKKVVRRPQDIDFCTNGWGLHLPPRKPQLQTLVTETITCPVFPVTKKYSITHGYHQATGVQC